MTSGYIYQQELGLNHFFWSAAVVLPQGGCHRMSV